MNSAPHPSLTPPPKTILTATVHGCAPCLKLIVSSLSLILIYLHVFPGVKSHCYLGNSAACSFPSSPHLSPGVIHLNHGLLVVHLPVAVNGRSFAKGFNLSMKRL
ncbi:hypothetical protein BsWGS_08531 [Bradybaena similaris]